MPSQPPAAQGQPLRRQGRHRERRRHRRLQRTPAHLRRARQAAPEPGHALRAVCRAYLEFSAERPALYQAMFVLPTDLKFASAETPPRLHAAFGELVSCFRLDNQRRDLFAEVTWSALHGMAVLSDAGRIPPTARRNGSISSSLSRWPPTN